MSSETALLIDAVAELVACESPSEDLDAVARCATVVDDVAMRITHVVRAAEHLSNTPVQVLAYEGLGYPVPKFAHVPVVNEPAQKNQPSSKKKLSKRDMKKFVTPEVRAKRRAQEILARGEPVDEEAVLADIKSRDERDRNRAAAPLKPAPDARLLDTSQLDIECAVRAAIDIIEAVRAGRPGS